MTEIPLILKIKKQVHKDIAKAHDIIMEELYKVFNKSVLHGGTAVWRCYGGNRFSEDIDVYIPKDKKKLDVLFENFKKRGFIINKRKIGENSLYSSLELDRVIVRFEALFKNYFSKSLLKDYETCEGNFVAVYTLSPENLIKEKIEAYLKREKIRDLYDIFFLLKYVDDKKKISNELKKLIDNFKNPVDAKDLQVLILEGVVPDTKKMLDYITRF